MPIQFNNSLEERNRFTCGMQMSHGGGRMDFSISSRNSDVRRYEIRDLDGKTVGTFRVRKKSRNVKKKNLGYDYRELSDKIMKASTPYSAGQAAASARIKIASLSKKLYTGDYDDQEIKNAIVHAKRMERAAKKRLKNMQEEEIKQQIQKKIEREEKNREKLAEKPKKKKVKKEGRELSESEIRSLIRQIQESLRTMKSGSEKAEEPKDLPPSKRPPHGQSKKGGESTGSKIELERKRKKHRLEEIQDVMRADMEYLRNKLTKMERERISCSSGVNGSGNGISAEGGVSLELGGVSMPVPGTSVPVSSEGGSVDVSV